jgi:sodium transport system permease protein
MIGSITPAEIVLIAILILPGNAIIAALLLSVSFFARSYKEATSYGGMLMILIIMPILISLAPNMRLHSIWAWIPLTNVALAVKEILKGTLAPGDLAVVVLSSVGLAGILLKLCTAWCKRENVLFRV